MQVDDPLVLTASKVSGKYADVAMSYQFQIRSGTTVVYDSGVVGGVGSGSNVTHTPTAQLDSETNFTWRVRAAYQGAVGSWSSDASFKSPVGAFIRGNEVRDPLTIGRTVGETRGPVQFVPGVGLKLLAHESHVLYRLPITLQQGEFSMLILGADEGSEGDKSKVFAMQEGPDESDVTTDDYRMTAELRGANYSTPGAVTCRMIPGDGSSNDCPRVVLNFDSSRWYFWRFSWRTGSARLQVIRDSETGQTVYDQSVSVPAGHPYRPEQHFLYLGVPAGRAGLIDATLPGGIYKNVYIGPNARPAFPAASAVTSFLSRTSRAAGHNGLPPFFHVRKTSRAMNK